MNHLGEFHWTLFLLAVAIRALFDFTTCTRKIIERAVRFDAKNMLDEPQVRKGAKIIGFLEGVIYIYLLIRGYHAAIAAILIFKGFHLWTTANTPEKDIDRRPHILSNYYSYAIGNFISFIFAFLIVEVLIFIFHRLEWL